MAHYDCSCCGESYGISHNHCAECKAGRCPKGRADDVMKDVPFVPAPPGGLEYKPVTPLPEIVFTKLGYGQAYDYEVKSWPQFFGPMVSGKKLHDMRNKRDRAYKIGDRMLLREFDPFGGGYTGRSAVATITYITSRETPCALSSVGLGDDMAILSVLVGSVYPDDDRNA
jgi:hypothetical protein